MYSGYSSLSYVPKNLKMDSIKEVNFGKGGFIVTENDMFHVSSFSYTLDSTNTLRFYIECTPEERQHIKDEFLSKQRTLTFIGPKIKDSIIPNHLHYVTGFSYIYGVHFIIAENGISIRLKHKSEREFPYDEHREYVHRNCIDFNYNVR